MDDDVKEGEYIHCDVKEVPKNDTESPDFFNKANTILDNAKSSINTMIDGTKGTLEGAKNFYQNVVKEIKK